MKFSTRNKNKTKRISEPGNLDQPVPEGSVVLPDAVCAVRGEPEKEPAQNSGRRNGRAGPAGHNPGAGQKNPRQRFRDEGRRGYGREDER